MKKILTFFVPFLLLLFAVQVNVNAESDTLQKNFEAAPLATVNIQDAEIISKDGNSFKISFVISNREGFQSGVKYGVRIYSLGPKGQIEYIVGEKVYDEVLSLSSGSEINKEIVYDAPNVLDGKYSLALLSYNEKGFPFAFLSIGNVDLTKTVNGVEILADTCFVSINEEPTHYKTTEFISIKKDDNLYINCKIINYGKQLISSTPVFETRLGSSYGEIISSNGINFSAVEVNGLEKKDVSILIPTKSIIPQAYNVNFSLKTDKNISNTVNIFYSIIGTKATIYNASLNKDIYEKGEIASVKTLFNLNKSEEDADVKYFLNTTIVNDENNECGSPVVKEISQNFEMVFGYKINMSCSKPKVVASITDSNGSVLSQIGNPSLIKKSSVFVGISELGSKSILGFSIYHLIVGFMLLILIVIIFMFYFKKKKIVDVSTGSNASGTNTLVAFLFILSSVLFSSILSTKVASADTFAVDSYGAFATVSLNKTEYLPNETIVVSGMITPVTPISGHVTPSHTLSATVSSSTKTFNLASYPTTVSFTAPVSAGSYIVPIKAGQGCEAGYRIDPKDGACAKPSIILGFNNTNISTRAQNFTVGESVVAGDIFSATVFSHTVTVTASSGDTISSIANKIISAVNATTVAQWEDTDPGSAPDTLGTSAYAGDTLTGDKPEATLYHRVVGSFNLSLDTQHQFGVSGYPADWTGGWKYYNFNNLSYSVVPPPSIKISSSAPSITGGNCVDITWKGNYLNNCFIYKTPVGGAAIDITPGDMNTNGKIQDCPAVTTTYKAFCSNVSQACVGNSSSDNRACYDYGDSDENCILSYSRRCSWVGY